MGGVGVRVGCCRSGECRVGFGGCWVVVGRVL